MHRSGFPGLGCESTPLTPSEPIRSTEPSTPDLPLEHHPVQQEGGVRILVHFPCLAASVVRVEDESVHGKALEKDHARRRNAIPIGGREGSRLRKQDSGLLSLLEPFTEQLKWGPGPPSPRAAPA